MTEFWVPLTTASEPISGNCLVNYYWIFDEATQSILYRVGPGKMLYPQCNVNREISEVVLSRLYPGRSVFLVPVVYETNVHRRFFEEKKR